MNSASEITAARDAIIAEHGPWIGYNIHLGEGVYTREPGRVGTAEFMVHGLTQNVADLCGKPLSEVRVLDLGCHEGGYSIELALQGCAVVGIEGRRANVAKARFAAQTLGLDRAEFVEDDVRNVTVDKYGRFDVVVCFGILYHLPAPDAVRLIERSHECCERLMVVRTAVGLAPNTTETVGPYTYRGRRYQEDVRHLGASLDNPSSVMPSRVSLLNLLADVGFTSVFEVRNPVWPGHDAFRDSVTLAAIKGVPIAHRGVEGVDTLVTNFRHDEHRAPAWVWQAAHPQQGLFWRARERLTHTLVRVAFESSRPIPDWVDDQRTRTPSK